MFLSLTERKCKSIFPWPCISYVALSINIVDYYLRRLHILLQALFLLLSVDRNTFAYKCEKTLREYLRNVYLSSCIRYVILMTGEQSDRKESMYEYKNTT